MNRKNLRRLLMLIIGMSLSVGIYSDVDNDNIAKMTDQFFVKMAQQGQKYDVKKAVSKAQKLYKKAVKSYRNGNRRKAKEYYSKSMGLLSGIDLEVVMNSDMVDDYKEIFAGISDIADKSSQDDAVEKSKYTIPMDLDNELVQKYIKLYTTGRSREEMQSALERSGRYRDMILEVLRENNLPDELVYLPIVESLYYNNNLSCAGALGLWQFMQHQGRAQGLKINYWIDERKDPYKSTVAAAQYLKELYTMFDDWHLALCAYNRGEYGLARDLDFARATNINQISDRKAVPSETEHFVPKFIAAVIVADNYKEYGFNIKFEKPDTYEEVIVNDAIDLKIVADCSNTSIETLRSLNPALRAWCTPHNYKDFRLKLPSGSASRFLENIVKVEDLNPSRGFVKYKVAKGDCLSKIAKKFNTTVASIKSDNSLTKDVVLRINQTIVVRPGRDYFQKNN